jgi:SAM-dependent methyltransferase
MSLKRTAKEAARHFLYRTGLRRGPTHAAAGDRRERFAAIYEGKVWSYGRDDIPLSGEGSSIAATSVLRSSLPRVLEELGVRRMLDLGCGDFTWMSEVELPCDYVGVDIVTSVIEANQKAFSSKSREFQLADAVQDHLPQADVVLCREVLFHLSFADAFAALQNILATGCTHLMLTSDRETSFNSDIATGDFRLLNLQRRPFSFPDPAGEIEDSAVFRGRFIGIWEASVIRRQLS